MASHLRDEESKSLRSSGPLTPFENSPTLSATPKADSSSVKSSGLPTAPLSGRIIEDTFGFYKKIKPKEVNPNAPQYCAEDVVKRYTLSNSRGMTVQVINYGATIVSIRTPNKWGVEDDVVLGFEEMNGYTSLTNHHYFGGTIGRVAGVIEDATFKIGNKEHFLTNNSGSHHTNGGFKGFDKVLWHSYLKQDRVIMTYVSKDREEGYPGDLLVQLTFYVSHNNQLVINITAMASKPTPISITNYIYFNLAGHGSGPAGLREHCIMVNADKFVLHDPEMKLPTGELQNVGATYYDLRIPRPLDKALRRLPGGGYDHYFCLSKGLTPKAVTFAARLVHPASGRFVEISTDNPALHVYTANDLPNLDKTVHEPSFSNESLLAKMDYFKPKDYEDRFSIGNKYKTSWPRPPSEPEEEHVFPRYSELSFVSNDSKPDIPVVQKDERVSTAERKQTVEENKFGPKENAEDCLGKYEDPAEINIKDILAPTKTPPKEIEGKMGAGYVNHGAICLMPQEYPNAINVRKYPNPILYPGERYERTIIYRFGVAPQKKPEIQVAKPVRPKSRG